MRSNNSIPKGGHSAPHKAAGAQCRAGTTTNIMAPDSAWYQIPQIYLKSSQKDTNPVAVSTVG